MKAKLSISFRTKIIAMVIGVVTLLGAGSFLNVMSFGDKFKSTLGMTFQAHAENLGDKLGAQFYERYGDVQAFAINPAISSLKFEEMQTFLDQYVSLYGIYELIVVVDKFGNLVGVNSKDLVGKPVDVKGLKQVSYKDQPWFKAVISGDFTESKENGFAGTFFEDFVSDPVKKAAFGEDRYGTSFSAPIKDSKGNTIGVISNRTSKKWFEDELSAVFQNAKDLGIQDVAVTLVNKEGKIISDYRSSDKNPRGKYEVDPKVLLTENFIERHKPAGEIYLKEKTGYTLSKDGDDQAQDVVGFHRVNNSKWISSIGWGAFVHSDADDVWRAENTAEHNFFLIFGACVFISMALAIWFGVVVSKSIDQVTKILAKNSDEVTEASRTIANSATQLSEASTEQAAAIQETVAAVDEISAMVEKNAEAANRSKTVSAESREAAEKGRSIVANMLTAIEEIDNSNNEISLQMESSNRELSQITKLINDIGSKTKVINEIVFQTKLLSFNASVEAARAGEYGKGFAVVAEEVGNLAQMSGNAAKEITTLLEESVHKVESIVSETKTRVERLMNSSKEKVKAGAQTANDCNAALGEILDNVQSVDSLVSEIAVASSEQSTGIREISKAVGQMEQVTQQNTSVAQSSSVSAEQLKEEAETLKSIVGDLVEIVSGQRNFEPVAKQATQKTAKLAASAMSKKNVIELKKRQPKSSSGDETPVAVKNVSGGDFVPSSEDPGFME